MADLGLAAEGHAVVELAVVAAVRGRDPDRCSEAGRIPTSPDQVHGDPVPRVGSVRKELRLAAPHAVLVLAVGDQQVFAAIAIVVGHRDAVTVADARPPERLPTERDEATLAVGQ